jgi:hypothetical protein
MSMTLAAKSSFRASLITVLLFSAAGCAQLSVQGGDKPIHMIVDVNIKVDRELDQFFAFENQIKVPAATQPASTLPATTQTVFGQPISTRQSL